MFWYRGRFTMTRYLMSCLATALVVASPVFAQSKRAQNVPEIPYDSVPNFLKMPPGLYMGEAMGVATNSKGHVFVFTRSANTRLFEFDKTGNIRKVAPRWAVREPHCRFEIIPKAGHAANLDNPETVNKLMLEFLAAHAEAV